MEFGDVLNCFKADKDFVFTRKGWICGSIKILVKLQTPDENSFMTEQYLYMEKWINDECIRFPLDLSCESIFADDWEEIR